MTVTEAAATKEVNPSEGASQTDEKSLEDFLREVEQASQPAKPTEAPPEPKVSVQDVARTVQIVQENEQAARAAKANQDLTASVDALADMDDAMKRLPKWAIRGAMMDRLQSDGRFLQLWLNRHADPQTWDKAREALGKELLKDLPADDNVTGSRMAARAAVRGNPGKNTPDAPPDFSKMSPAEIMRFSQEHGEKNARRRG